MTEQVPQEDPNFQAERGAGPSCVEYALIILVVFMVVIAILTILGPAHGGSFSTIVLDI